MTISELLRDCRYHFNRLEVRYVHPSLYVLCIDELFERFDEEARELAFLKKLDLHESELTRIRSVTGISIEFCTPEEREQRFAFLDAVETPQHWLPLLDPSVRQTLSPALSGPVPSMHFYGFKGGQARSTVLAMIAKSLAQDGYRVLMVDLDIEAPSLDKLFDAAAPNLGSTVMGLCGWSGETTPISVFGSIRGSGCIDLIPCRPGDSIYDMDFASFAVRSALDLATITRGLRRLKSSVLANGSRRYDIVLFDHRTGIAPSVLPAVREWRGPVIVSVRPDGLSEQALGAFASLFAQNPDNPGAYVCFSLDPDDAQNSTGQRSPKQVQTLLAELSDAIAKGAESDAVEDRLPPDALHRYWVPWYFDRALLSDLSPELDRLSSENQASIRQLRDVLGFASGLIPLQAQGTVAQSSAHARSPSGAVDTGWFIETPEINRLFFPSSPWSYIVGRKGTGKTRLYKEMASRGLAEPLFAAADFEGAAIKSQSPAYSNLLDACERDYRRFWWALLGIALSNEPAKSVDAFERAVNLWADKPLEKRREEATAHWVQKLATNLSAKRYFLIDGIETAARAMQLRTIIEELLLFMLTIQSDSRLANLIGVRLFLRTDLLRNATQNIEQQTSQRRLELRWDSDSIFNFVLARIEQLDWFNRNFPSPCQRIRERKEDIRAGRLSRGEYEPLLLAIFPQKLRRNNIQTITFLDTYFCDAGGDTQSGASFYPRLFENFLFQVSEVAKTRERLGLKPVENDRISHTVVLDAHVAASAAFIEEVVQELYSLLSLSDDDTQNRRLVDSLISAFDGQTTPFAVDDLVKTLQSSMVEIDSARLRDALQRMKEVGIFENRPGYPGQWRAGRLYKSALRMKYVR